jgi:hypothetical protein
MGLPISSGGLGERRTRAKDQKRKEGGKQEASGKRNPDSDIVAHPVESSAWLKGFLIHLGLAAGTMKAFIP